jgi:phosphoglycerate kinase
LAKNLLKDAQAAGVRLLLPADDVIAEKMDPSALTRVLRADQPIPAGEMGLDIGPATVALFSQEIACARTIVWNGPMGVFEVAAFARGTMQIAQAIAGNREATSIVGGGDSVAAVHQAGVADKITHISTGGGASLEFLEGKKLPGVEALTDK